MSLAKCHLSFNDNGLQYGNLARIRDLFMRLNEVNFHAEFPEDTSYFFVMFSIFVIIILDWESSVFYLTETRSPKGRMISQSIKPCCVRHTLCHHP